METVRTFHSLRYVDAPPPPYSYVDLIETVTNSDKAILSDAQYQTAQAKDSEKIPWGDEGEGDRCSLQFRTPASILTKANIWKSMSEASLIKL